MSYKNLLITLIAKLSKRPAGFPIDLKGQKLSVAKSFGYHEGCSSLNNVASFLTQHLETIPDRPILSWVHPDKLKEWSYNIDDPLHHDSVTVKELDHLVAVVATGFKKLGIKKGDRVIIFVPMCLYLYTAMFALQKIGAIATFLDGWARRDQMDTAAKVVGAKAFISVEKAFDYMGDLPEIGKIPLKISIGECVKKYDASIESLMKGLIRSQTEPVEKEHTALITFTTGSSGTPKGADRTHRFLAAQHYALDKHLPFEKSDLDLPVFPIFSLNNLAAGVTTVLPAIDVGQSGDKDALVLMAQMKSAGVTTTTLSPSLLRHVYAYCLENDLKMPFLRRIITGGAPISRDDLIKTTQVAPNAEVLVLYGSTEVEPMAHIEAKDMISRKDNPDPEWEDEGVNVGKFDSGLQVKYLKINKGPLEVESDTDWANLEVKKGSPGEIIVSGEHVCQNYYNNAEAFKKSKIKDHQGIIWHRTGDIGRVDGHGDLWFMGRIHNAINRGGSYFFPVRAEVIMKKLPFVEYAAYLGMPDAELGEKTYAVFTKKAGASGDKNEWITEIKRVMEKNSVTCDKILLTDEIPLDARHQSKVEYQVLREKLQEKA
jgi:acyl-CoA synthetase (AMP-forming)/AMP-acid ligase II